MAATAWRVVPEEGKSLGLVILPDDKGRSRVQQIIPESPAAAAKKLCEGKSTPLLPLSLRG